MENPVIRIRQELHITRDTLALMADISYAAVAANERGRYVEPSDRILKVFEDLGYNRDKVKEKYIEWRESQGKNNIVKIAIG